MTLLEFKSRARKSETTISNRRTWDSVSGKFAVTEFVPKLAGDIGSYFLAIERRPGAGDRIISRHRTRHAAEDACSLAQHFNTDSQVLSDVLTDPSDAGHATQK